MGYLILYASVFVVGALAMRPKLSLAVMSTVPVALGLLESRVRGGLPAWAIIGGALITAYCLAAAVLALFFRRSGDAGGDWGSLPIGREARYSRADKAGLWYTFALLCVAAGGSAAAVLDPPYGSAVVRAMAMALVLVFAGLAVAFRVLLRDRDVIIRIHEEELEVGYGSESPRRIPWREIAGHTFWFGIFRVYDKSGRRILRVDNTIDGFVALLYHVNRKTFRAAALAVLIGIVATVHADERPRSACAHFSVVDAVGRPVPGALVVLNTGNWDPYLNQVTDVDGKVSVLCEPTGPAYDVTVTSPGYSASRVSVAAVPEGTQTRVTLQKAPGRYVRVLHRGAEVPGVPVTIRDADGSVQNMETDGRGMAHFAPLTAKGEAMVTISLAGFITQRARVGQSDKNGPLWMELPVDNVCHGFIVLP